MVPNSLVSANNTMLIVNNKKQKLTLRKNIFAVLSENITEKPEKVL
jgi:hypothetical protein